MSLHAPTPSASAQRWSLEQPPNLRAVILLAGTVRPSALLKGVQRCVLDLPIDNERRLMDLWIEQCEQLARILKQDALPVRVMLNQATPALEHTSLQTDAVTIHIEEDRTDYRGTGGTVRDAVADYDDDEFVLIAGGGQVLVEPLIELTNELAQDHAAVSLLSHGDGKPAALALIRCGSLRKLASVGFLDLKEQVLPRLAQDHRVRIVECPTAAALPVRTSSDYLAALRWHHRQQAGHMNASLANPFAEDWHCSFAVIEPGAELADDVRVHDSVVLAGAKVAPGATIVRSIVAGDARVQRNARVMDELMTGQNRTGPRRT